MKEKDIYDIRSGWFGVQARYINLVDENKRIKLNEELQTNDSAKIKIKKIAKKEKLKKKKRMGSEVIKDQKKEMSDTNKKTVHQKYGKKRKKCKKHKGHMKKNKKYTYNYLNFYKRFIDGPIRLKCRLKKNISPLENIKHDVKIYKNAVGKYYILLPISLDKKISGNDNICGIDLGIRTFATVYDPCSNTVTKYGNKQDTEKNIKIIQSKLDTFQRKRQELLKKKSFKSSKEINTKRTRKKYNTYSKVMDLCRYRLRNAVGNLHRYLANILVRNNKVIVLGDLHVQSIMKKKSLHRKTKRLSYFWSHYRFKQFLQHKAMEAIDGCEVIIQNESYTTMTCGRCDKQNKKVGTSEIFVCGDCGYVTDRDVNGARNILRKYLGLFPKQ